MDVQQGAQARRTFWIKAMTLGMYTVKLIVKLAVHVGKTLVASVLHSCTHSLRKEGP